MLNVLLSKAGYDYILSEFLFKGFKYGFHIGHNAIDGLNSDNTYQQKFNKLFISAKLEKEIELGRTAGPFVSPPFDFYHLSPIFLVPKPLPGDFRLILDLSFPKNSDCINAHIDDSMKTVTYSNVRQAIKLLCNSPFGSFSAKVDIKDAFRLIPIHPEDFHKLCFKFDNKFYFEKVLPQGCASSCFIFESFSTAVTALRSN